MKKILILSAATLVLSSCGIYNKYKPVSEVPEGLYGSETVASADTANFGNLSWREVFTDSYLQNLIDSALVRNTDMQTAHLRVKEAEASLLTSKLSYLPSLFLAPEGAVSSFDRGKATQTYSLPVTASWELDIFGKVTTAKRRAKAAYEQSKEYEQAVKTQLVSAVANTYYTLLMLDAQYEISVSTETAWKESVRTARAAFYPSITLSGSAGWTNSAGSMIINPGKFVASAVASLTQPLFNKGVNIAQLKIAKAQQEEARLSFEQTLLNAGVEVNEALVQYQTAREKSAFYDKQITSLQTAARSTSLLMEHSNNTTYLEVLTAQQTLLNARLSQVANRFTEIQGVITLYQALGGGRM